MYTDAHFRSHIYDLQRFLRRIQRAQGHVQPLAPDGIFGPETAAAVRDFQRRRGLPVTGTADFATWSEIYAQFLALISADMSPANAAFFPIDGALCPGAKGPSVAALQLILNTAVPHFPTIPPIPLTGEYDVQTADAVRRAQGVFQLPQTGCTDRATWEALALFHNGFFSRTPLTWTL
ncbi:MAG: peptidoglycan-binding domain-containing protein [Agathobaculum sp.]|jgi:peptidoglycan hydrolase-like protein with peptidoglycan-binding domain|uniref:peptidoglycan-binding domain-containing protein n=1 Tax=Agathobaculum sp. TaxID=2048138 RepID=UPI003D8D3BC2